jgi:hypothetical protein
MKFSLDGAFPIKERKPSPLLTCNMILSINDGYPRDSVSVNIKIGGIVTWEDLFNVLQQRAPAFVYREVLLRC